MFRIRYESGTFRNRFFFAVYAQMRESEIKTSRSGRLCGDAACGILLCRNESSDVRKRL